MTQVGGERPGINAQETIILLYLIHHPCHPYEMAKHFRQAIEDGVWGVPRTRDLARANKLYRVFDLLVKKGFLVRGEPEGSRGRTAYRVNYAPLFEEVEEWKTLEAVIQDCFKAFGALSRPEYVIIRRIAGMKVFDLTTLVLYVDKLLGELTTYQESWMEEPPFPTDTVLKELVSPEVWKEMTLEASHGSPLEQVQVYTKVSDQFAREAWLDTWKRLREDFLTTSILDLRSWNTVIENLVSLHSYMKAGFSTGRIRNWLRKSLAILISGERGFEPTL